MTADLIAWGNGAAARNGLTAMPVNTGEDLFKINAANFLVAPSNKYLIACLAQTAAIANLAQWRIHKTDDADWLDFGSLNGRDQTGAYTPAILPRISYPFEMGKQLACELNNGNNSQVDSIIGFISDKPDEKLMFGNSGFYNLPPGYSIHRFTGATTVTAGVMSNVPLTAVTFNPDDNAVYHIAGALGLAATGLYGRLQHRQGGTQGIRPGFLVGDIATPDVGMWTWQDYGTFTGDQYPLVQHCSVAADTAEEYLFAIKKVA